MRSLQAGAVVLGRLLFLAQLMHLNDRASTLFLDLQGYVTVCNSMKRPLFEAISAWSVINSMRGHARGEQVSLPGGDRSLLADVEA